MPLYDMHCDKCGPVENVWAGINEEVMACGCGGVMHRVISATRSNPDWQPYEDENLVPQFHPGGPVVVKSRQHRKELMKRLGLVDGWSGL
jgi:putative FmdB family regulatory protein